MAGAREAICETAVRLFNEQSFEAVSLRQIAAEAGTTIGNLTYHFARKEDLLIAILADLHAGYAERLDRSLSGTQLLGHIVGLVYENETNRARYPFYFGNLSHIIQSSSRLREENDAFQLELFSYYSWAFGQLAREGWLELTSDEAPDALAYALIALQATWAEAASPRSNGLLPAGRLPHLVCLLLGEHVSEGCRAEYAAICDAMSE